MMFSSCVGWLFWLSDIERLQNQDGVAGHIPVGAVCRGFCFDAWRWGGPARPPRGGRPIADNDPAALGAPRPERRRSHRHYRHRVCFAHASPCGGLRAVLTAVLGPHSGSLSLVAYQV